MSTENLDAVNREKAARAQNRKRKFWLGHILDDPLSRPPICAGPGIKEIDRLLEPDDLESLRHHGRADPERVRRQRFYVCASEMWTRKMVPEEGTGSDRENGVGVFRLEHYHLGDGIRRMSINTYGDVFLGPHYVGPCVKDGWFTIGSEACPEYLFPVSGMPKPLTLRTTADVKAEVVATFEYTYYPVDTMWRIYGECFRMSKLGWEYVFRSGESIRMPEDILETDQPNP